MTTSKVTHRIIRLAQRHGSVITLRDAEREGASDRLMGRLVDAGVFRRQFRGVYVLAGAPNDHFTQIRCALVAVRSGAVASHDSAAWLQRLIDSPPAVVDVTASNSSRSRLRGVRVHRSSIPIPSHSYDGIPCTTPLRTLVDLASRAPASVLDEAVDRALARGLVRLGDLSLSARSGRRGEGRLRAAVDRRGLIGGPLPSVLESHMLRLFRTHRLPVPQAELVAGPDGCYRIDLAYPDVKLAIEGYGYAWHHTPEQLSHDLERQAKLVADGWTVLAYTWRQITEEPERVAGEIAATHARLAALSDSAYTRRSPDSA
jgi:hypothetical protein